MIGHRIISLGVMWDVFTFMSIWNLSNLPLWSGCSSFLRLLGIISQNIILWNQVIRPLSVCLSVRVSCQFVKGEPQGHYNTGQVQKTCFFAWWDLNMGLFVVHIQQENYLIKSALVTSLFVTKCLQCVGMSLSICQRNI